MPKHGDAPVIRSLRIKKVYLEAIRAGEKTREWRGYTAFYKRLLEDPRPDFLVLHYQDRSNKILVEVKRIIVKKRPMRLKNGPVGHYEKVYEISLGRVKNIKPE